MDNGISALELNAWLVWQLDKWAIWAENREPAWLATPTGNPDWPELNGMFVHAFTPLHRYADHLAGDEPVEYPQLPPADWPAALAWARRCLARHEQVASDLLPERGLELFEFKTRVAGTFTVPVRLALSHAATHCFWHLGGIAQLLRARGIDPPQGSDLLFWASEQTD
ncbi:hypothetical protein JW859_01235 [bacterium]|nr:hypothetical protein [bacterium]